MLSLKFVRVLIVISLLVCCRSQSIRELGNFTENDSMTTEKTNFGNVSLTGKARVEGDRLIIEYTVHNETSQTIYLFDEMVGYEGSEQVLDRNTAYCFFEEPDTLRIVRAELNLPHEKEIRVKEKPFARSIESNSEKQGKIEFSIPVLEKSPFYAPPKPDDSKIIKCIKVRLLIGWSEIRNGMAIEETEINGEKVLRITGGWGKPYYELLEKKFNIETEVVVHKDTFDRQMPLK